MKKIYILYFCLLALCQSFCVSKTIKNPPVADQKQKNVPSMKFGTTLDSLQGTWHPEGVAVPNITISGHDYNVYSGAEVNGYYKIYFSDVAITEDDWTLVSGVDVNATTGKYVLVVDLSENVCTCYKMSAVYDDGEIQSFNLTEIDRPYHRTIYQKS